jgi:hypothetical protein
MQDRAARTAEIDATTLDQSIEQEILKRKAVTLGEAQGADRDPSAPAPQIYLGGTS